MSGYTTLSIDYLFTGFSRNIGVYDSHHRVGREIAQANLIQVILFKKYFILYYFNSIHFFSIYLNLFCSILGDKDEGEDLVLSSNFFL